MAVQPPLFGTIAMEIGAAHSLNDLSLSEKIQSKSAFEILVLAMPYLPGRPLGQHTTITFGCLSGFEHAAQSKGEDLKLPSRRYPLVDMLGALAIVIPQASLDALAQYLGAQRRLRVSGAMTDHILNGLSSTQAS
jgi:hypothetical protein